jgi:hypothetical protein
MHLIVGDVVGAASRAERFSMSAPPHPAEAGAHPAHKPSAASQRGVCGCSRSACPVVSLPTSSGDDRHLSRDVESAPVDRISDTADDAVRMLDSPVPVFSGTSCVGGAAEAVVFATGSHIEILRIAALGGAAPARQGGAGLRLRWVSCSGRTVAVEGGGVRPAGDCCRSDR